MELTNEFRVGVGVETAWAVLTDVERIAPCMPGAELHEVEGDEYRGVVKVKVGPITAQYKGRASFVDLDKSSWRAVLKADGRDTRGAGNASATVTATLVPDDVATIVKVVTDLTITGKVAQFGRGVLAEVSAKLIDEFADRLEHDVLTNAPEPQSPPEPPSVTNNATIRHIDAPTAEPVDLVGTAGASVAKRAMPVLAALLGLVGLVGLLRRRRGRGRQRRTEVT